jgi:hypothetical protein
MPNFNPAMVELETRRYGEVRAAGWDFDHRCLVWRHRHTGRTGLNQHVIHECLRNHDALPPCGDSREATSAADRRQWVERAARLREIEAATLRSPQVQIREQQPTRALRFPYNQPWGETETQRANRLNHAAVADNYARNHAPASPQRAAGELCPITDPIWQA